MPEFTTRRVFLRRGSMAGLTIGAMGGLWGACGGSDDDSGAARSGESLSGTIRYIKNPNLAEDAAAQRRIADGFERSHPRVTVKPSIYDIANAETELTTAFAGNNPPDVTQMLNTAWPQFAAAGGLLDLTDRVQHESFAEEYSKYPEDVWDGLSLDGKVYGIPTLGGSISTLWVNLDLMQQAGVSDYSSSFEAMREAANRTRQGDVFGYGMTTTMPGYAYQSWINYIYNAGGDLLNEDGTAGGLDTPDVAAAFDYLRALHFEDKVTPPPGAYDFPGLAALFQAGRLAILHLDGTVGYVTGLGTDNAVKFDFDAFSLPEGPGGQWTPVFRSSLHLANRSENLDAAWEFAKYYTSADVTTDYLRQTSLQPLRTDVVDAVFSKDDRATKLQRKIYDTTVESGRVFQPHPRTLDMIEIVQGEFERLIRGRQDGAGLVEAANAQITDMVA